MMGRVPMRKKGKLGRNITEQNRTEQNGTEQERG